MSQSLELPSELFATLQKTAAAHGMSAVEWIASVLPALPEEKPMELWDGLWGAFDSRDGLGSIVQQTSFGDLIAAKLEKQGITRPK